MNAPRGKTTALQCTVCGDANLTFSVESATTSGETVALYKCENCFSLVPDFREAWANSDTLQSQIDFHEDWWVDSTRDELVTHRDNLASLVTDYRRFFGEPGESTVCEIGCGRGTLLAALKQRGYDARGCEPAPGLAELGYKYLELSRDMLAPIDAARFLDDLSERKIRPDVFVLWHVLEHLEHPLELLKRLGTLLKENGRVIVQVPMLYFKYVYPEHLFFCTPQSLQRLAELAGLRVVIVEPDHKALFLTAVFELDSEPASCGEERAENGEGVGLGFVIRSLERAVQARDEVIEGQEVFIDERLRALSESDRIAQDRWLSIQGMERMIMERDDHIKGLEQEIDELKADRDSFLVKTDALRLTKASLQHDVQKVVSALVQSESQIIEEVQYLSEELELVTAERRSLMREIIELHKNGAKENRS